MPNPKKQNASGDAGVIVVGWQAETTQEITHAKSNTDAAALNSRSTSTEAQRSAKNSSRSCTRVQKPPSNCVMRA